MTVSSCVLLLLAVGLVSSAAAESPLAEKSLSALGITSMRRGVVSHVPAQTWEKAMVTGNGVQGAMAKGRALEETIVLNDAGLQQFRKVAYLTALPFRNPSFAPAEACRD